MVCTQLLKNRDVENGMNFFMLRVDLICKLPYQFFLVSQRDQNTKLKACSSFEKSEKFVDMVATSNRPNPQHITYGLDA